MHTMTFFIYLGVKPRNTTTLSLFFLQVVSFHWKIEMKSVYLPAQTNRIRDESQEKTRKKYLEIETSIIDHVQSKSSGICHKAIFVSNLLSFLQAKVIWYLKVVVPMQVSIAKCKIILSWSCFMLPSKQSSECWQFKK